MEVLIMGHQDQSFPRTPLQYTVSVVDHHDRTTLIEKHQALLKEHDTSSQQKDHDKAAFVDTIKQLQAQLRLEIKRSHGLQPDFLEPLGIHYNADHSIDAEKLNQHLCEKLAIAVYNFDQYVKNNHLIERNARLIADAMTNYFKMIASKQQNHDNWLVLKLKITDWLCRETYSTKQLLSDTTIAEILSELNITLNSTQTSRINRLSTSFINSKLPNWELLTIAVSGDKNTVFHYQQQLSNAIKDVIQEESKNSRFFSCMSKLADHMAVIDSEDAANVSTFYNPMADRFAKTISIFVIRYMQQCKTDCLSNESIEQLLTTLPKYLLLNNANRDSLPEIISSSLSTQNTNLLLCILESIAPLLSGSHCTGEDQSKYFMEKINQLKKVMDTQVYLTPIITGRARQVFQSLPDVLEKVLQTEPDLSNLSVHLIPRSLIRQLEQGELVDWVIDSNNQAYVGALMSHQWLHREQLFAMLDPAPDFGRSNQGIENHVKRQLIHTLDHGAELDYEQVKRQCENGFVVSDSVREKWQGLSHCYHAFDQSSSRHQEAANQLDQFQQLAKQWLRLVIAGTKHYKKAQSKHWWSGQSGAKRANDLLASMDSLAQQPDINFNQFATILRTHLITFNAGSLGTYVLQALSNDKTYFENNNYQNIEGITQQKSALLNQNNLFSNDEHRPRGVTGFCSAVQNSAYGWDFFRSKPYLGRQQQAQRFMQRLDELAENQAQESAVMNASMSSQ